MKFMEKETATDLHNIPPTLYSPGEEIIKDIIILGWVVVFCIKLDNQTNQVLDKVSRKAVIVWPMVFS